jgi:aquaglyceroporin related protein, other eukaryote
MPATDQTISNHHDGHTHAHTLAPPTTPTTKERRRTSTSGQPAYTEKGPLINHDIPQADVVQQEPDLNWSRIRRYFREPFSEFFGVFILILFGDGSVAQVVLSGGKNGDYQSITWGWG